MIFLQRHSGRLPAILTWCAPIAIVAWWVHEEQSQTRSIVLMAFLVITCIIAPLIVAIARSRRKIRAARDMHPKTPPGRLYALGRVSLALTLPLSLSVVPLCLIAAFRVPHGGSGWCLVAVPYWWAAYAWIAPLFGLLLIYFGRPKPEATA